MAYARATIARAPVDARRRARAALRSRRRARGAARDPRRRGLATATITVTFDRPVAGSLDRTVDPRALLAIAPAVAGTTDWRDPVTLRFRPAAPLRPNRLRRDRRRRVRRDGREPAARPYAFSSACAGRGCSRARRSARTAAPDSSARRALRLVVDAPVDSATVAARRTSSSKAVRRRPVRSGCGSRASAPSRRRPLGISRGRRLGPRPLAPIPSGGVRASRRPARCRTAATASWWSRPRSTRGAERAAAVGPRHVRRFSPRPARVRLGRRCLPDRAGRRHVHHPGAGRRRARHLTPAAGGAVHAGRHGRHAGEWVLETGWSRGPRMRWWPTPPSPTPSVSGSPATRSPRLQTTGYAPAIDYPSGRAVVERSGARTFGLTFVNVDTLEVVIAPIPDSLERHSSAARVELARSVPALMPTARCASASRSRRAGPLRVYGVKLPAPDAGAGAAAPPDGGPGHRPPVDAPSRNRPSDRAGAGHRPRRAREDRRRRRRWSGSPARATAPRAGAAVTLHDAKGGVLAPRRTDTRGPRAFAASAAPPPRTGGRRAKTSGPQLRGLRRRHARRRPRAASGSTSTIPISARGGSTCPRPGAASAFRSRARSSPSAASIAPASRCTPRRSSAPACSARCAARAGDSLRWVFKDRGRERRSRRAARHDRRALARSAPPSSASRCRPTPARPLPDRGAAPARGPMDRRRVDAAIGSRSTGRRSSWSTSRPTRARASRRLARGAVEARYLFGAPMGRAAVRWTLRQQRMSAGSSRSPAPRLRRRRDRLVVRGDGRGQAAGAGRRERHRHARRRGPARRSGSGSARRCGAGRRAPRSRPRSTDVNRQTVSASRLADGPSRPRSTSAPSPRARATSGPPASPAAWA